MEVEYEVVTEVDVYVLVRLNEVVVDELKGGVETHPVTPHVAKGPKAALAGELKETMAPAIAKVSKSASAISRNLDFKRTTSSVAWV